MLDDLARFLRHMLAPTQAAFGPAWIKGSLRIETGDLTPARGLFWHPAPGADPTEDIWGHYGFTGTGMWISPTQGHWACPPHQQAPLPSRPRTPDRDPQLPRLRTHHAGS